MRERATKGKVTKALARTVASGVKMIQMKCCPKASGHQCSELKRRQYSEVGSGHFQLVAAGNAPWAPKSRTKIRPAMTGKTEKGRSMTETSSERPLKRNLVMDQAAAMPNRTFSGNTTAATPRVMRTADQFFLARSWGAEMS